MIGRVSAANTKSAVPIIGLGAGTHAKSVVEAISSRGEFEIVAVVDDDPGRVGTELLGIPIEGPDALARARADGVLHAFAGIGGIGSSEARRRAFARLRTDGFELPPIIHATAVVSDWARIGPGCHILAGAVLNADAELGENTIVNTRAVVEHDCRIGADVHVAPGALIAGEVRIGDGALVGIGSVVIQQVAVGAGALIAAGAVVIDDVPAGSRVAGVPARPMAG
jgi:sugar O-acyltransferase (sialic acid O-acetyltransferase NeuD family)